MKKFLSAIKNAILVLIVIIAIFSCDVLQQASELHTFTKCKFRLKSVDDITLAGINIQDKESFSDLTLSDAAKVTQTLLGGSLPLSFTLNIEGKNPNNKKAALNKLDWILFIDDIEMTSGTNSERVEIPANNGTGILPLFINIDLKKVLSKETQSSLLNFGFNLAGGGGKPTRIMVKAKPTVYITGQPIKYPGYIKIREEFSSDNNKSTNEIKL